MTPDHPLWWRGWRVGVLCGVCAMLAFSCADDASAQAADRGEVFATATDANGGRIDLRTGHGPCVGHARLAEYTAPSGERTPGCWVLTPVYVLVSFLDGDRGNIPVGHLKRAKES